MRSAGVICKRALQRMDVICVYPNVCAHLGALIRRLCGSARVYMYVCIYTHTPLRGFIRYINLSNVLWVVG